MRLTPFAALGLAALVAAGCAAPRTVAPDSLPAPIAGVAMSSDERAAARTFVAVVQQVEPVAEAECRARAPRLNCDFRVVVDDTPGQPPNAFQTLTPDGRPIIAFTLSLIQDVQNADELAFVMAHEAAHHVAGHIALSQRNAAVGALVFGRLAGVRGADAETVRSAQQLGAAVGARRFSQEFELEADALGTVIAAQAGFDPVRGAQYFFRLPDPGNRFLGTHPPNAERVAVVEETARALGL